MRYLNVKGTFKWPKRLRSDVSEPSYPLLADAAERRSLGEVELRAPPKRVVGREFGPEDSVHLRTVSVVSSSARGTNHPHTDRALGHPRSSFPEL